LRVESVRRCSGQQPGHTAAVEPPADKTTGGCHLAALFLFVLAVVGGVVVGNLVWENTTAAEVTVFGQPVTGYSQGWLLAMAAALGLVVALLLVASVGATKRRRERRRQLRRLRRDRRHHRAEPDVESTSVLDQFFGHHDTRS
jgi:uncharacterized membrane protein YccC